MRCKRKGQIGNIAQTDNAAEIEAVIVDSEDVACLRELHSRRMVG